MSNARHKQRGTGAARNRGVQGAIDVTVLACDTTCTIVQANRVARQNLMPGAGPTTIADAITRSEIRGSGGAAMSAVDIPLMSANR